MVDFRFCVHILAFYVFLFIRLLMMILKGKKSCKISSCAYQGLVCLKCDLCLPLPYQSEMPRARVEYILSHL